MKKTIIKLKTIIAILFILLVLCNNTYANEDTRILQISEFTEEYKEWLNLPEEERKNILAPRSIEIINNRLKKPTVSTIRPYSLPASYDLRKIHTMTVKDQGSSNVCWTFASMGSLESNLQVTKNITVDLSERHIDYATSQSFTTVNPMGFNREVNTGANEFIAYSYFTNGMGTILETDMPFSFSFGKQNLSYIQGKTIQTKVEDYVEFPNIKRIDDPIEKSEVIDQIKEHIKTKGALYASINGDALQRNSEYFNTTYSASYYDGTGDQNHAILVVGWDDNFSKTKFNSSHRPMSDGAWIIRNSWGTSWGENGYAYVSYEDNLLGAHMAGIQKSSTNIDYNNLYQHDELGASNAIGYNTEKVYAANVFKKTTEQIEKLTEVSFYLWQDSYCKVYVNPKSSDKSRDNLIQATQQQVLCSAGYHTIKLDKPLALTGNEFVVVIEYYIPGGKANAAIEMKDEVFWKTATSKLGESYLTTNLTSNSAWEDTSVKWGNNSIKAFSDNVASLEVLTVGNTTQNPDVIYDEIGGNISIPVTTNSVANGANLDIIIKKDNVDVTNKFTITGKTVNNDAATVGIRAPAGTIKGTYQVEISYGSLAKKTTNFTITEYVHITSISLDKANVKIRKGDTANLTVTVNPQNATNKTVNITSSNTNVATVDQTGTITTVSRGKSKITAKSVDGNKIAECMVTVIDPQVIYGELVYLSEATAVQRGIVTIPVTGVDIDDDTNLNVKVKFDNRDITSNFTITGNKINNDKATIKVIVPADIEIGVYTIELSDPITEKSESKTFEIKPIEISINDITQVPEVIYNENGGTITLDIRSIGIANGENIDIKVKKEDTDVTSNFTITSNAINDNKAMVKLKAGEIQEGTYKVRAIYSTSSSQEVSFDILKYIHVDKVELNKENITMKKGESTTITLSLAPENAVNKNINISNIDPSVATIDENLKIDALKRGETTITAISEDGNKTANCKVTVIDPTVMIDGIQYDGKVKAGKRGNIKIHASSIDVENDVELQVIIKSNEIDVTDKFVISGNKIIDNSADMLINIPDDIELGTYQIQVKFEERIICDSNIQIEQVAVNIGDINLNQGKIYERLGGTIIIPITSKNIANSENLNVKITKNDEDVTEKFKITGNQLNEDNANIKIEAMQDVKAGEYKVEISYEGLVKQETTFTVEAYIQLDSIKLSKNQVNLKVGEEEKITITINPQNATNKNIIIENSNTNVATMKQDGTITAKSKGETTITIKSEDGNKTAICKVTVEEKNNNNGGNNNNNGNNNGGNNNNGNNNNNNGGNNGNTQGKDTTTKDKNIPNTGNAVNAITIIISGIGTGVSFILYRRYKYI